MNAARAKAVVEDLLEGRTLGMDATEALRAIAFRVQELETQLEKLRGECGRVREWNYPDDA